VQVFPKELTMESNGRARRGFAAMDPEKQRKIASSGGRASHASGKGHEWDREAARAAALKAVAARKRKREAKAQAAEKPAA